MSITGGFGVSVDLETGAARAWYMGPDGVQRWADTGAVGGCRGAGSGYPYR